MRPVLLTVFALAVSAPVLAGSPPPPPQGAATAPGAIAGGKIIAFDAASKMLTVDANGQKVQVDTSKAAVAGQLNPGAIVDVTFANGVASAVAVRPANGQPPPTATAAATTGTATAPGAIAGGKIIVFDSAKKTMVVEANGQKYDLALGSAVVNGQLAVGRIVDVTFANGSVQAVNVRP